MPDDVARLPWSEEQWASVNRTVQEAAGRARVASSFLPLVGPLPPGQTTVPAMWMKSEPLTDRQRGEATARFEIDEARTLALNTLSCQVHLTTQQVEDPELAAAKQLLRQAADLIGRLEDCIVFNGHPGGQAPPKHAPPSTPCRVQINGAKPGLLDDEGLPGDVTLRALMQTGTTDNSESLVKAVSAAVLALEKRGHYGPFACVLGHKLYQAAINPSSALAIPKDRIMPFLEGGPLHRSSVVDEARGVVVSLAGAPIDLVVGSDVHVTFLQVTLEPRYVLRVSERFVLRLKQPTARCVLVP